MKVKTINGHLSSTEDDIAFNLQINNPFVVNRYPAFKLAKTVVASNYPDVSVALWVTKENYNRCSCHLERAVPSVDVVCQKTWKIYYTFCPYCGNYYESDLHK